MSKARDIADVATGIDLTGNVTFGDNDKAIFGAELEIYSDATHARIREYGGGQLKIQGDNMQLLTSAGTATYLEGNASTGAVTLYHASNAPRVVTTSTGIDVTGNVTMATGGSIVAGGANDLVLNAGESGTPDIYLQSGSSTKVKIEGSNGNVGIGCTPNAKLQVLDQLKVSSANQSSGAVVLGDGSSTNFNVGIARWNGSTNAAGAGGIGYFTQGSVNGGGHFFYTGDAAAGSTTERMRIDSSGAVTMPYQPAFFATPNTNQNNIANNNSSVHVLLQTEILDNNSDFASSTFTAPVTGKYMLSYSLCLLNMDSAADYYIPQIKTSNRDISSLYDPGQLNGDPAYWTFTMSVLTDMDANDTSTVRIIQNGGTAQTDVEASSLRTYFSGYLVA